MYKEIHQEVYEELLEQLGREPTCDEIGTAYGDRMSSLIDSAEAYYGLD
jgi:hypothetical protein